MKINKYTVGLVGAGLISLSVNAEEKMVTTPLLTALSSTTISGYVDTSAHWNPGSGNLNPAPYAFNAGKQDGFNLNAVGIVLEKPVEESQWASGYKVDLMYGPDAAIATPGTEPIKQAYVVLRAPVGNGLDLQLGRWDTILGYEATENYKNPNYTRSYAYSITPTEHDGILGSYHVCDLLTIKAGVANTVNTGFGFNARNGNGAESQKAYLAGVTLTAPDSAGFLKGSVLNVAAMHGPTGFNASSAATATFGGGAQMTEVSINGSMATPLEGLRVGATWEEFFNVTTGPAPFGVRLPHTWVAGMYASFRRAPDSKLSFHARGEYYHGAAALLPQSFGQFLVTAFSSGKEHIFAATGTIQYDIWQNVISRLEIRWDHADNANAFGGQFFSNSATSGALPSKKNDVQLAVNIIYKF